jgi:predicted phosphoserine aminotransferase
MDLPRLPADLRPTDGRFGSGPSKVRPEALDALAATGSSYLGTSHRGQGVRAVVGRLRRRLAELFSLPDGYRVVLGNGGASAFWDAAAFCLIERRSAHAVFGQFSARFAAVATGAPHLEDPVVIESPPGTHPDLFPDPSVDLYALTQNETSTGVMMPVLRPASSGLVAVDATSAAGAIPVDPARFDAYYFSPQKVFGSEGGLWAALLSPAALERINSLAGRWAPPFLDLRLAVEASAADQTYNTPALVTLFLFADQVEWILGQGGLAWAGKRQEQAADVVYGWAERSDYATPFVPDPAKRSHTVATIDLDPTIDAAELNRALAANGIVDTGAYRRLGRNQIRLGMFPNVTTGDLERLIAAIDWLAVRLPRRSP